MAKVDTAFNHNTINLYGYKGWAGIAELFWTDYAGVSDTNRYFRILRDNTGAGAFNLIKDSLSRFTLNYDDTSAYNYPLCRYIVEMVFSTTCFPSQRNATAYTASRSNVGQFNTFVIDATLLNYSDEGIKIYPNPAKEKVTIILNGKQEKGTIKITDVLGQTLLTKELKANNEIKTKIEIPLTTMNPGIYFITLEDLTQRHVFKLNIQ